MIREKILNRQLSYGGTKINMLVVLMSVLLMTSLSQNPQPIDTNIQRIETNIQPRDTNIQPVEISLQYGHNSYSQLSRYFRSNEQYTISDMKSEVDLKSYHFCYIQTSTYSQVEIQHTLSLSSNEGSPSSKDNTKNGVNNNSADDKDSNSVYKDGNINIDRSQQQQQQQQEKIVYDLDDIISTENVLATQFYHTQRQTTSASSTTQYTQSQSSSLLLIVMPTKYITLKLQQQTLTQSQSQQQTHQVKQKRYKVSSKLSTSFSNTIAIAKFIKINNINHNEQGSNINNINTNSKQEYVLMTDTQLFKVQIDKSRIRQQNYYGSIYINGKLNTIQQNSIKRNLQQHQQLQNLQQQQQQMNEKLNNQTETNAVNQQQQQQQKQQKQKQQQQQQQYKQQQQQQLQEQSFQVQRQSKQQRQQEQHLSYGVSVSNKEILLYSNKHIYLYDLMTGKLNTINKVNQSTGKINNKIYTQLIGSKSIELSIIEYTNSNNNKEKINNNNNKDNDNDNRQQQLSLVLIVADTYNDIKLSYYTNQTQLLNSFSQQTNIKQSSITTTKQTKEQSLLQQQLYSLPYTHKCRHIYQYNNKYIFVQCKNHLLYYSLQQIINCKHNNTLQSNKTLQFNNKTQTCINSIKARHLNLGYHIQSIYLNEQTNYITVTGIDKYQTFHIDYNSQQNQINSIYPINTYYFNQQNIKQVYLIDYNNSLILTKTNLYIVKQLPQTKQIYCKTIDQHSHKGLSQPTGVFNGNITIQGVCQDNLININNKKQYQRVQNSTYCRYTVPVTVNITYVVKTYEFLWYILLGLGIFLSIIGFLYCLIKRQKLNQIYKTLEEENQHGQQVVQHTVITENNESQQQSLPIDVPK